MVHEASAVAKVPAHSCRKPAAWHHARCGRRKMEWRNPPSRVWAANDEVCEAVSEGGRGYMNPVLPTLAILADGEPSQTFCVECAFPPKDKLMRLFCDKNCWLISGQPQRPPWADCRL